MDGTQMAAEERSPASAASAPEMAGRALMDAVSQAAVALVNLELAVANPRTETDVLHNLARTRRATEANAAALLTTYIGEVAAMIRSGHA